MKVEAGRDLKMHEFGEGTISQGMQERRQPL